MNFIGEIIKWYQTNKRSLPWRDTTDPYLIWLSEIILQQTRVEQGLPYYHRFAEAYPDVARFAAATEDEILKMWQGLGYYSRGRNMHKTAQLVMEEYSGYFPRKYEHLLKLKGVGEYTAAAIASFAANEPKAVVDGNVFRLLSRYFAIGEPINTSKGKKVFTDLANQLIDVDQAGLSNQAMMEFGSLMCRPRTPDCGNCPLRPGCAAYQTGSVPEFPVKIRAQRIRTRYFNYLVLEKDNTVLINKRGGDDIWQNLHDLPLIETDEATQAHELVQTVEFERLFGKAAEIIELFPPVKHILSHQKIFASFFAVKNYNEYFLKETNWSYIEYAELENRAQPKLIFDFFKNFSKLKSN